MSALPKDTAEIGQGYLLANRFELVRLLHAGDSSAVFLASDHKERISLRSLKVRVALKVFDRSGTHAAIQRERIRGDFERVARFIHRNLVRVFECIEGGDFQAISMEYVEGPPLARLVESGALSADTVLDLVHQITGALTMLHVNGVSHGRLDLGKILLTRDGVVKVNLLNSQGTLVSHSGLLAPTSPATASATLTPQQQDVAAIGEAAFRMLHGYAPGARPTAMIRLRHLKNSLLRACSRRSGARAPLRFEQAIERALSPDPLLRYHHAGELQRELEEIIAQRRSDTRTPYAPRFPVSSETSTTGAIQRMRGALENAQRRARESFARARLSPFMREGASVAEGAATPATPQLALAPSLSPVSPSVSPQRGEGTKQNVSSGVAPSGEADKTVIRVSGAWIFVAVAAVYMMVMMLAMRQIAVVLRTFF